MQLSAALGEMLASLVVRMFGDGEAPSRRQPEGTAYGWRPFGRGAVKVCLSCRGAVTVTR
jgi:hypothetical protein